MWPEMVDIATEIGDQREITEGRCRGCLLINSGLSSFLKNIKDSSDNQRAKDKRLEQTERIKSCNTKNVCCFQAPPR